MIPSGGERDFISILISVKEETLEHEEQTMVASQNGEHRNGHVLVENQQTRLNADSEVPEETSKSKVYRDRFLSRARFDYKEASPVLIQSQMNYGTHVIVSCQCKAERRPCREKISARKRFVDPLRSRLRRRWTLV